MDTGDIEGPASGQITPGEASMISDMYTADMSMEINLRNVLLEPKKWKLDSLDEIYSMLDYYCELQESGRTYLMAICRKASSGQELLRGLVSLKQPKF